MQNLNEIKEEVRFKAVRSRGPGGQNVNKVSSAAILTWDYQTSVWLTEEQKNLIQLKLSHVINSEGHLFFRSDEFRDLEKNKNRCLEKLGVALTKAFFKSKKRRPTKPTVASREKKRVGKEKRSQTKKLRQRKWGYD